MPAAEQPSPDALSGELEEATSRLEASEMDESFKLPIREELKAAAGRLDEAKQLRKQVIELEQTAPGLPAVIEDSQKQLNGMREAGPVEVETPGDLVDLRGKVEQVRAGIATLESDLAAKERELAELSASPVKISTRLPAANAELSEAEARVAALGTTGEPTLGETADRLSAMAELAHLRAEVELLEAQRTSQPLREQLVELEQRILERRLAVERSRLEALEAALKDRMGGEIDRLRRETKELAEGIPESRPQLAEVAAALPGLLEELRGTAQRMDRVSLRSSETRAELESLRRENERLRRQIELSGLEGALTQILLEHRQRLPEERGLDYELKLLERELANAQLEGLRIEELRLEQEHLETRWKGDAVAAPVLEARATLLERYQENQRSLIRDLAQLGADRKAYRDLVLELTEFLSDQLFLRRSSEPIDLRFFSGMPRSIAYLFSPAPRAHLLRAIRDVPERHPMGCVFTAVLALVLILLRRRFLQSIERSGRRIRRISTDRLVHTLRALLETVLLALPLPLVLGFLSWALASDPDPDPMVRGFGLWLGRAAWVLMWIIALCHLASEKGVGRMHLGWSEEAGQVTRRWLPRFAIFYLPALLVATVTLFDGESHTFGSLGRFGFIVSQAVLAWVMVGLFRPDRGVFAKVVRERPDRLFVKSRALWVLLLVGVPVVLGVMAVVGYVLTAFILSEQFLSVLRWIAVGVVVYGVGLRWFMIKQRRLALAEAIEERKARRDAAEKTDDEGEEAVSVDDDRIELALDDVARQTRRLLRSLVGVGVLVAIAYNLARSLPIDQAAAMLSITGAVDWFNVAKALLTGMVVVTVIKNLPGLLDLLGLREAGMEPGTRYAVATLCQYALGATGLLLVADALELDWTRFGWIAAALSVGLGFGLQEIVANFVCGIILLFERPMRVGDVVTVGEVTGTVSRIRMRATTITNWERQEFVVPNKDFITGSLINWTLTSPLNRITINVGVAYGSDTVEARRILTEIAEAHPVVLDDPAPLVNFEAFADSTLNLSMRCYLPTMDNRLKTITEINEEIDRRFKEAGIEIAFPQRDLHLRTVPNELIRGQNAPEKDA